MTYNWPEGAASSVVPSQNAIQRPSGEKAGLTTEERAELARLRKENKTLRMERDLLKKATAYFARESETG